MRGFGDAVAEPIDETELEEMRKRKPKVKNREYHRH
jgi:hypothetical protein